MIPHDILTLYAAKPLEYIIAILFLLLFVPFWQYVQGSATAREAAVVRRPVVPRLAEWFAVPDRLHFHPGHAWARVEPDGLLALGIDDFGHKLVGPLAGVRLPAPGTALAQGEVGWTLLAGHQGIDMLSPVDGVVVDVNRTAITPGQPPKTAYDDTWLVKVRPTRLSANLRGLLTGEIARRWMAASADALRQKISPELGLVYQDGGAPVYGIAPALEPAGWEAIAREFFLTADVRGGDGVELQAPEFAQGPHKE